ncbi:MAG: SDR family oxidoreductase [Desulfamplus sp.]|nr:SDR family oxidoreductase [Desulfamplus sp.]
MTTSFGNDGITSHNSAPVTLITGTSRGIGRFLANHYLEQGHKVIGCSRKPADWIHPNYEHHIADVAQESDVKQVLKAVRTNHGRLDNLINNAGIAAMNHFLLTPTSVVEKVFNTNVVGTFLFCRESARLMKKNNFGRIVNFSTVAVPLKLEGEAVYAASKAAVICLTQVAAREFAEFGITVNAVGPTPIKTDLIAGVSEEKIEALLNRQAIPRFGTFEDVANVIDFFLKKESSFITGQVVMLGGV